MLRDSNPVLLHSVKRNQVVLFCLCHLLSLHSFFSNPRSLSALCFSLQTLKQRKTKNPVVLFSLAFSTNFTSFFVFHLSDPVFHFCVPLEAFGDRCSLEAKPGSRTASFFIYGILYLEDKGHPESCQRSLESMELTPVVTAGKKKNQ